MPDVAEHQRGNLLISARLRMTENKQTRNQSSTQNNLSTQKTCNPKGDQSCLAIWDPWTVACKAPLSMGILQAGRLEWVAMFSILEWVAILLQGTFPTQGLNLGLPHCRQILYRLSHQGSPRILEWVAYPFSRGSSRPRARLGSPALQVESLPATCIL